MFLDKFHPKDTLQLPLMTFLIRHRPSRRWRFLSNLPPPLRSKVFRSHLRALQSAAPTQRHGGGVFACSSGVGALWVRSRGRVGCFVVDWSPAAGAPPSVSHLSIALGSASTMGFFDFPAMIAICTWARDNARELTYCRNQSGPLPNEATPFPEARNVRI